MNTDKHGLKIHRDGGHPQRGLRLFASLFRIRVHPCPSVVKTFISKAKVMSENDLLFSAETRKIIGASMEVINVLGHGFYEKVYENSLVVECGLRSITVIQQPDYPIIFKDNNVGTYIPDLICFAAVVVDTKTIDEITDHEIGKMLNYLKVTGLRVGLIINFKHAKLEWKRVAL